MKDAYNKDLFKETLRQRMIELLESKRGVQSLLAKSIGESPSYFSQIKRGNPVNAFHLKAVGIIFGPKKVVEMLEISNLAEQKDQQFEDEERGKALIKRLATIESLSPQMFDMTEKQIDAVYNTVVENNPGELSSSRKRNNG